MFWLLSFIMPGLRRQTNRPFDDFSRLIQSPQSRFLIFQIVGLFFGAAVVWLVVAGFLSLISWWGVILLTIALAGTVWVRGYLNDRRQRWLDAGCCANCGYDLRGTPDRCPECGRDTALDEPTWRKLRREWGNIKPAPVVEPQQPVLAPVPTPVVTIPTVMKTPDFHEGPIPLEGDDTSSDNGSESQSMARDQ